MNTKENSAAPSSLIACQDCDLIHRVKAIPSGYKAKCSRCGSLLYQQKEDSINRTLALVIAGLILYWPANFFAIMSVENLGRVREGTMFAGVWGLYAGGMWWLGTLVLLASMGVPLVKLAGMFYVLLPLRFNRPPLAAAFSYRMLITLNAWGMLEVYMLGILIAIIKLSPVATVMMGVGLYSFVAFMLITVLASATLDPREMWKRLEAGR